MSDVASSSDLRELSLPGSSAATGLALKALMAVRRHDRCSDGGSGDRSTPLCPWRAPEELPARSPMPSLARPGLAVSPAHVPQPTCQPLASRLETGQWEFRCPSAAHEAGRCPLERVGNPVRDTFGRELVIKSASCGRIASHPTLRAALPFSSIKPCRTAELTSVCGQLG